MNNFDIKLFLDSEFEGLNERVLKIQRDKMLNSFNLFTVSSYNSYLENFHSDILAMLLNPEERHSHYSEFLILFIEYLTSFNIFLDKDDYALSEVTREKGRIDIWIKDNTSKKSIIIENKINGATDQENQLQNYYAYAVNKGFDVDAIVYLTLNEQKKAPLSDLDEVNNKVINISAFSNRKNDLCNGWLKQCYYSSKDEDTRSFLYQYLKLIKHLSQEGMNRKIEDEFYNVVSTTEGFEKVRIISNLHHELERYRADLFFERIGKDYFPFKKSYRYRPNHWLFEGYIDKGIEYKLDVYFHNDGSARIDFWIPKERDIERNVHISDKLKSVNLFELFEYGGFGGGMYKAFELSEYFTIEKLDISLYNFVKSFFLKLRNL